MAFKGIPTDRESWLRFCNDHQASIDALGSIAVAFSSAARFDELLQSGKTRSKEATAELVALSDEEWRIFDGFVEYYRHDWQTYFVQTLYPAYFREVERRAAASPD